MSEPDVVTQIDTLLADQGDVLTLTQRTVIARARYEIVVLRDTVPGWVADRRSKVRAAAWEEAARVCERESEYGLASAQWNGACDKCAAAIRALKDKRDE